MNNSDLASGWDESIDPTTHKLRVVSGANYTVQKIRQKLQVFYGEWFLDTKQGYPYFDLLLGQIRPDVDAARASMVPIIIGVPGVKSLTKLTIDLDNSAQTARISFECLLVDGSIIFDTLALPSV